MTHSVQIYINDAFCIIYINDALCTILYQWRTLYKYILMTHSVQIYINNAPCTNDMHNQKGLVEYLFFPPENLSLILSQWRTTNFDLWLALKAFSSTTWHSFICHRLPWHTSVVKVISDRPVILISKLPALYHMTECCITTERCIPRDWLLYHMTESCCNTLTLYHIMKRCRERTVDTPPNLDQDRISSGTVDRQIRTPECRPK
jgi:hypothetical protein